MNCEQARALLSSLLDGEAAPAQEADVRRHLDGCAECRAYHDRLKRAHERLGAAAERLAPPLDDAHARRLALGAVAASRRRGGLRRTLVVFGALAACALLAVGVIALDVNTRRAQPQEVQILGSPEVVAGATSRIRVQVRDGRTGAPIRGASIHVTLKVDPFEAAKKLIELGGFSDERGDAVVDFDTPEGAEHVSMEVTVQSDAGKDRLDQRLKVRRPAKIALTSDKPLYQPDQEVHLRALAMNTFTMRPIAGRDLTVTVEDPNGNKVFRQTRKTSDFGIVGVDFTLADEVTFGRYKAVARVGEIESELAFEVKKYRRPQFDVGLTLHRRFLRPGEHATGTLEARYFHGKPVRGRVVVAGATWVADRFEECCRATGETSEDGRFDFDLVLPPKLFGTELERGDAVLRIEGIVTDSAGHTETEAVAVTVSKDQLKILVVPDGGFARGVENRVFVVVSRPDGTPAPATLAFPQGRFETDEAGIALVPIGDLDFEYLIEARARDGARGEARFNAREVTPDARAFALRIEKPVIRAGSPLVAEAVCAFQEGTIYVDLVREGHTVLTRAVEVKGGRAAVTVDLPPEAKGTVEVHATRLLATGHWERDTRLILVEPPEGLRIKVTPSKPEWRPDEKMEVTVEVTDARGEPIGPSALTIAVVDPAVLALHEARPGLERVYLAIEEDLLKPRTQLKPMGAAEMFGNESAARPYVCGRGRAVNPVLTFVSFAGKQEFFDDSARRFNDWLAGAAAFVIAVVVLLGLMALIALGIRTATRSVGPGPAFGCAALFALGVIVLAAPLLLGTAMRAGKAVTAPDAATAERRPGATGAPSTAAAGGPRIRHFFPETLYWNAELVTDERGRAPLTLPAADTITRWKATFSAVSRDGRLGAHTADLKVFQDFFVDIDLPLVLTQGDVVSIPVAVYNYLKEPQAVTLELDAPDAFEVRDERTKRISVGAGEVKSASFRLRAAKFGTWPLTVFARGTLQDAVRREIEILPDGKETLITASDRIAGRRAFTVRVPEEAVDGASAMWVRLYPSSFSEAVTGLEGLVRLPHG
jgi:anti-sigma factor RsiW